MSRYCMLLLSLAVMTPQAAALSPEDLTRIRQVTAIAASPDGRHVAYVQQVPRKPLVDEDGEAWSELHVISGDQAPRPYLRGEINASAIAWSADSRGIFYLAKRGLDEFAAVWAIPVDGGESFPICRMETDIAGFALHPDGKRIALLAAPPKPEARTTLAEKGIAPRVLEEDVPDQALWMARIVDNGECEPTRLDIPGSVARAAFSPDGNRLLLAVAPNALVDSGYMETRLRVVDLEGSELARIDNLGKLGEVSWSPDGKQIAFIGVNDRNDPREGRLKLADPATGEIRTLLDGRLEAHVMDIAWSAEGRLETLIHRGVGSEVWSIDPATERHRVRELGDPVVTALATAADASRIVALANSPAHPSEAYELNDAGLERLTDSNPWLAERELGRQEVLEYQASDGLELQGILIYPVDYTKGTRYPLIIYVHGGPEAHRSNGWLTTYSNPIQVAAGRGHVGFVPNYRGSTGRGVEFSKLDQHAYATPEFDDIVDGKNVLVERGLVDAAKVGITGGSYGGYATAWSATALSEHYAAGVMFIGISNQLSKFGTTDIPVEMHEVHARAWPWDDWQWYLDRSPIFHAQKSRTPLLIVHGDADPRVHPSQSLEMYRYLKHRGQAPVRLVLYPGEKHGNKKAGAQHDYSLRLLRWMDHYLKGPGGEPPPWELDYSEKLAALPDEEEGSRPSDGAEP